MDSYFQGLQWLTKQSKTLFKSQKCQKKGIWKLWILIRLRLKKCPGLLYLPLLKLFPYFRIIVYPINTISRVRPTVNVNLKKSWFQRFQT